MKFKFLPVFILAFFMSVAAGQAAMEQLSLEPALTQHEGSSAEPFPWMVSGDEELLLKAGTVFSDGGHHEGTELPYLISNPAPIRYPRWALRQGWQGDLSIAVEITTDGKVGRTKVMQSTGHEILDEVATKAVKSWMFHPAMKNGKAIVTCIQVPVRFQINPND